MSLQTLSTTSLPKRPALRPPVQFDLPPLENGDRLSRAEFERRYQAHPEIKKAELIEGAVYMPSPIRFEQHGRPHSFETAGRPIILKGLPGHTDLAGLFHRYA